MDKTLEGVGVEVKISSEGAALGCLKKLGQLFKDYCASNLVPF